MSTQKQTTVPYAVRDYTRNEEIFNDEIAPRMKKLLNLNQWGNDDIELMKEKWERQNTLMDELKEQCKKARAMTGRIIKFQHADSHAFYLVTKVNKTKCTLEWIDYMDGWVD